MISGDKKLNGLVLAGGKSSRMGHDKALIEYNGQPQFLHAYQLLEKFCNSVFISCRTDQSAFFQSHNLHTITDLENGSGPLGAIHSALLYDPESSWLVLACDLPFADEQLISELLGACNHDADATSFISPHDGLPEPLVAVWEPRATGKVQDFLDRGITCPRKVLINSNTQLIHTTQPAKLANINTPEEFENIMKAIS